MCNWCYPHLKPTAQTKPELMNESTGICAHCLEGIAEQLRQQAALEQPKEELCSKD